MYSETLVEIESVVCHIMDELSYYNELASSGDLSIYDVEEMFVGVDVAMRRVDLLLGDCVDLLIDLIMT